jgi:ATP-binding cassette, subfamily B, bacterial PglK
MYKRSTMKLTGLLWSHLGKKRQRQFYILLMLMFFSAFAELISLGAILPFLSVLISPEALFNEPLVQPLIIWLEISKPEQLMLPVTLLFSLAALFSGTVKLLTLYVSTRVSFASGADLGINIYRRTLFQPYSVHIERNSSEIINGIVTKTNMMINSVLVPVTMLINSIFVFIAILLVLIWVDPIIAFMAFSGFGLIYLAIILFTKNNLMANSQRIARDSDTVLKNLQEGLGGIRDVIINRNQDFYCNLFHISDKSLRKSQGENLFIGLSPRHAMESLGIIFIAFLSYNTIASNGVESSIPLLGALALAAQRLLPIIQQGYGAFSAIRGAHSSLIDSLNLLDQPLPVHSDNKKYFESVFFDHQIKLSNVSFSYNKNSYIFKDINLIINKGDRVGFIGITGSGKSTIIDIMMGLLTPTEGLVTVDGVIIDSNNIHQWQKHISHVPQNIFLSDNTIEQNIAFGIKTSEIDHDRVCDAAHKAQISDVIEKFPEKYKTIIGEQGLKLSGGQRQRLGIARALYRKADILVLDEATSALDNETECDVMDTIYGLSRELTVLIIAHRVTTLKNCDKVFKVGPTAIEITYPN